MADDIVIRAEGLGKKYVIGHDTEPERYMALRDVMMRAGRNSWRKASDLFHGRDIVAGDEVEEFWALRDVSFEVRRGEVLGIIGRNGAGKSTLLKILSRITEPSEGRVTIRGRLASLLEVGTGFHPELTGRENIYLNGAILGMRRAEIKRKFDEIVAFAEVEKFLDTPVKRYSSGMYVRLAFAVAAHLEPDILVVDEVLAVGDPEFQRKCIGKMRNVSKTGRTVLFVSHNLNAVLTLCETGILLHGGQLASRDSINTVCEAYNRRLRHLLSSKRSGHYLRQVSLLDNNNSEVNTVRDNCTITFKVVFDVPETRCLTSLIIKDARNSPICELCDYSISPPVTQSQPAHVLVEVSNLPLMPGQYSVDFWLGNRFGKPIEHVHQALYFEIAATQNNAGTFAVEGPLKWNSKWTYTQRAYHQLHGAD